MPGYVAQDFATSPPRNFSRPTRSVSVSTVSTQPRESVLQGQSQVKDPSRPYPTYPPPPYSRGANRPGEDDLNGSFDELSDVTYVPGHLFGEIVPDSQRTSYSSRTLVSQPARKSSRRRHKPTLSIDTNVVKAGSRPKQIRRVVRSESNNRRGTPRQNSVKPTRGKDLQYLAPTTYNGNDRSYPRPPSSVYSVAANASRPTPSFAANPLGLRSTGFPEPTALNFEEDETLANKERIRSTATIFEEDQVLRSRSNTDESNIVPTPRRSKGWWNVITTPFQNQKRFTEYDVAMEKVPDVPALPQAYSTNPQPRDLNKTQRISPEEVRQYMSSEAGIDRNSGRARQDSDSSWATSIDTTNSQEFEQQHNRLNSIRDQRNLESTNITSQRRTTAEFSPDDREIPIMLRRDTVDVMPKRSTSSKTANPNQWLTNLRASEKPLVSAWSPLTSNQDESPESEMTHFHPPVVHPVAMDSIVVRDTRTVHERPQLPIQTAAWRVTRHSPDAFAFKRSSQSAQWDTDSRRTPTVQYRSDDNISIYYEPKPTIGGRKHKPKRKCFFFEGRREKKGKKEKKQKQKKKKRRCCCLICLIILILLLLAIGVVVPVVVTRQHHSSTTSIWVNLPGFPPIPTGSFTIAQPNMVYNVTGCVNPSAMWSCAVPKEEQASIAPNQPDQPDFLFTIYYDNQNSSSSSGTVFQPSPGVPALDEQIFLGNTTDNNTEPFDGVSTPFYISFNPPNSAFSLSRKLLKRQGGTDGINTSLTQLGSVPTSSSSSAPSSTINTIPDLATAIPLPSTNPDGTALPANLLPFPAYQPLRLYNAGQSTEHYGFYTYFDRAIFMKSIAIQNGTEQAEGDVPADADGGSAFAGATARCTWADSRFLVQIWTRANDTLLPKATGAATPGAGAAATFVRPGTMPYPVTVTLDRHGGGLTTKMLYCYGLDERGVVQVDDKLFQREDRSFGGTLVNPAEGPFTNVNVSTAMGGPGGIDGGTGGCLCRWQNF